MHVIIGMLMGAALGVMLTLIFVKRDTVTVTYSGYQPQQKESEIASLKNELENERIYSEFWKDMAKRRLKEIQEIRALERQFTDKYKICNSSAKLEPVKVGVKEALEYFTDENETYEHMMGDNAKEAVEYRINQIAIGALEEKSKYDIFIQAYTGIPANYLAWQQLK